MPTAYRAEAALLARLAIGSSGSPLVFTDIANIIGDIGPGGTTKMVDVTPHGPSPWTRMFPTVITFGPVSFELAFVPSSTGDDGHGAASGLMSVWSLQQLRDYRITWPDGIQWFWLAYVAKFQIKAPVNGVLTATLDLDTDGQPSLA